MTTDLKKQIADLGQRMDDRFDKMDHRMDRKIGQTRALVEDVQKTVKALGEGFATFNRKFDDFRSETTHRFDRLEANYTPLAMHGALARRVTKLEKSK